MSTETDILATIGGLHNNSLNHILNADVAGKNEDIDYEITTIKHSPYLNISEFSKILKENQLQFCILSLNIQSLNAKFDELVIFLHKLNESGCDYLGRLALYGNSLLKNYAATVNVVYNSELLLNQQYGKLLSN